ncbi:AfsR/SARP family transcriptional regulator [Actinokineospora sp. NBRC 105648]|uniref:AfsR/SARP family transcriptional regulator n=1 Tax=Actinokineospora sp. NBRC 105648 TaxID=3032206 RepID=UPI00249FCD53|nr:AfsR/SARP family transcriptional regulator [Actinokineospora sp. NBRC 105648]GLZ42859.1 hypothetical protein Acsp05_64830 [Actinokineospora sp. NBRC 105648]
MEFLLLGPLEARHAGATIDLGGQRRRAVLAALLVRANSVAGIGYLAAAAWERLPAAPESNVRTHVAGLRRSLRAAGDGDARLVTSPGGYRLAAAPGELDLTRFHEFAARGDRALRAGDLAAAMAELGRALALWRGEPLTGLGCPGEALAAEAARLVDLRLTVVERHAVAAIGLGRADLVVDDLAPLLVEHPLREPLWARFVQALHQCGRKAEALAAFARARDRLADELGVEPGPLLRGTHQRVLADAVDPVPGGFSTRRQLPVDLTEFTGRADQLRRLRELAVGGRSAAAVVCSIEGMAGVGKTRLAVHAAHQLADAFPGVRLWVDLRGFDQHHDPVDPAVVLAGFLAALGVPDHGVPAEPRSRAALYRHLLAGERALVLLDNAATEDQVRPLLPATPGSLVLITGRRSLAGLDGAHALPLDVLPPAEAVDLIATVAGRGRVAADPVAAARLAELCGYLPVAVALAARRLLVRPQWTVWDLADRLADADRRLARLSTGTRDLHTLFDLSYRALSPAHRRLFRLLGLHPDPDFGADSAAALGELTPDTAEAQLESLVDEHLLRQAVPGRYHFNSLVRAYARHRARTDETAPGRRDSVARLLTWYVDAAAATRVAFGQTQRLSPALSTRGHPARPGDDAGGHDQSRSTRSAARVVRSVPPCLPTRVHAPRLTS